MIVKHDKSETNASNNNKLYKELLKIKILTKSKKFDNLKKFVKAINLTNHIF